MPFRTQSSLPSWELEDPWPLFHPAPLHCVMVVGAVGTQESMASQRKQGDRIWLPKWSPQTSLLRFSFHSVVCTLLPKETRISYLLDFTLVPTIKAKQMLEQKTRT